MVCRGLETERQRLEGLIPKAIERSAEIAAREARAKQARQPWHGRRAWEEQQELAAYFEQQRRGDDLDGQIREAVAKDDWQERRAEERRQKEAELLRQQQEELHWHPVELSEPLGSGNRQRRMALNLMVGDGVRRGPGYEPEIYEGPDNSGYSTNRRSYSSLEGLEVWKRTPRHREG